MVELTVNEQIMDDARVVILWNVDNFELLIERLAIAYKKYRLKVGYPRDYFEDTPNYIKTLWNTNTPKVFQLLVDNMGWSYILKLDKEVFETRRATEGLYGADLNVYQSFLYGNFGKSFRLTDDTNSFDVRFGFKVKLPVNVKKIAYAASEAWKKFNGINKAPNASTPQLMNSYDANCRWNIEILDGIKNPLHIDMSTIDLTWFNLNNYTHYMYETNSTPMDLFYDAMIDAYLKTELHCRPHLLNGFTEATIFTQFSLLPQPELKNEGLPRLFRLMTFAPVF